MDTSNDIAIIGIGIHCPGASSADEFWRNLRDGVESVQFLSDQELLEGGLSEHELANPDYVKAGAFLDGIADFDAEFFGMSPKEAAIMDPQHRHFLEVCYEALEQAGHPPGKFSGPIGVFGGCGMGTYMMYNLITNRELMESVGYFSVRHTGNDKDFLATRVSYSLDLHGPAVGVQTACSTSLVAAHLASQSLLLGECDLALAGGVTIEIPHRRGYVYREREILSPDGHCRAFDHRSKGTIFGSGAGVVALRRLDDALSDDDEIYAVIKGSAINNDGAMKAGYLAPSVDGQAHAIMESLSVSGVSPETIGYVEAHGTGTPVGDPIEISALTQAYRTQTDANGFCRIGSVKTNIGHLDTAAGVVGLIKATLALKHGQIPASLNWEAPNPAIDFAHTPFCVNNTLTDWPRGSAPRRAAVNSLGVGGTNAHMILEEAPTVSPNLTPQLEISSRPYLLRLSAKSHAALDGNANQLAEFLRQHPETSLADVETTLRDSRQEFQYRRVLVAESVEGAIDLLSSDDRYHVFSHIAGPPTAAPIFLLPGGGAQYVGMAKDIYRTERVFRDAMDQCIEIVRGQHGIDLESFLFADVEDEETALEFERPSRQLPAIFSIEYALAKLWMSWKVQPRALLGHSTGENAAACLAGVFSLEDGLGLVCLRGELFESLPEGGMISVSASSDELSPLLHQELVVAVENAPQLCVVSGPAEAIAQFSNDLARREIDATRIPINVAAHSPMLEPVLERFQSYLRELDLSPPTIPFISNRTGTWITDQQATDPDYWVNHLRGTVHFSACLATLMKEYPESALIEVGPGTTLTSLSRLQPEFGPGHNTINSLRHRENKTSDSDYFLGALGRVWASGLPLDEEQLGNRGRRISLPTYAFQRRKYWIEPGSNAVQATAAASMLTRTSDFDDWFFVPHWEPSRLSANVDSTSCSWLVFADELGVADALVTELRSAGHSVVIVRKGDNNAKNSAEEYFVDSDRGAEGYETLVKGLTDDGCLPNRILYLWMLTGAESFRTDLNRFAHNLERSFYGLFFLLRAMGASDALNDTHIVTVANGMRQVHDERVPNPEKATQDGPCQVVAHEFHGVTCKSIDVEWIEVAGSGVRTRVLSADVNRLVMHLGEELLEPPRNATLAYRRGTRLELSYVKQDKKLEANASVRGVQEGGTYLITGGLGGIGLAVAEAIARKARVKLLLIGRTGLPDRDEWSNWTAEHPGDKVSHAIRGVLRLESLGATVEFGSVDVTDLEELTDFVRDAERRHGAIRGIVHAAGVINDSLIALKTVEEIENVFAPKIYGTVVLDMVFHERPLDFFVVFSSSSTVTGPVGQVDYVAANAYLNGFARSCSHRKHQRVVAINWGVWNDVGMAAEATENTDISAAPARHTLFREQRGSDEERIISLVPLETSSQWMLDEHRLGDGSPLLSGTAMVEIAADALAELRPGTRCEIRDMMFISPLAVEEGKTCRARVKLTRNGDHYDFELQSIRQSVDSRRGWLTHAQAELASLNTWDQDRDEIAEIQARCRVSSEVAEDGSLESAQELHLRFGPRWSVLRELHYGDGEALALLELPRRFRDDLRSAKVHPALLDVATGCAMNLIDGYDRNSSVLWIPVSYGRIRIHEALPARIYSWVRNRGRNRVESDSASFDVTIYDEMGRVVVQIDDFTIHKAPKGDLLAPLDRIPSVALEADRGSASARIWDTDLDPATRVLYHNVSQGILAEEGMSAFSRVVDGLTEQNVVISSLDLNALREQSAKLALPKEVDPISFERPDLANDYAPPETDIERQLVVFWEEILGIESVGVEDSFFDLGGHSLIAVRLFAKIKSTWGVNLAVSALFEAVTIRALAHRISTSDSGTGQREVTLRGHGVVADSASWTSVVPIRKEGSRPPFFCVAGKGGNPMNLRHLAARLGEQQPFYGIQHRGVDGVLPPHESIEEMAAACITDIKDVQPAGPYLLGGFSAGGLVAFEMARALTSAGDDVGVLAFLDTWDPAYDDKQLWGVMSTHLRLLRSQGASYLIDRIRHRIHRRRVAGVESSEQDTSQAESIVTVTGDSVMSDDAAMAWQAMEENYVATPYVGNGILFRPYRTKSNLDWVSIRVGNEFNGWDKFLMGGIDVVELPGGHSTMCEEPHVRILAKHLSKAIGRCLSHYPALA